jgi:ADP-ribose pyrophosphatase YjhB (NUDIX family)
VQQITACFECVVDPDGREADGEESLAQEFRQLADAPSLFPWYEQMLRDWQSGESATRVDAGSMLATNPHPEGYIRWLRSRVGKDPILMPAACAVVRDDRGRVLLHRRADSGLWGLPAGGMEIGERIDHTAIREVAEETGLRVRPLRLGGFYTGRNQWNVYPNGDQVWLAVACFLCEPMGGELRADGVESLDVGFFDLDRLPFHGNPWGERTLRRIRDAIDGGPEAVAD